MKSKIAKGELCIVIHIDNKKGNEQMMVLIVIVYVIFIKSRSRRKDIACALKLQAIHRANKKLLVSCSARWRNF